MSATDPYAGSVSNPIAAFDNMLQVTPSDTDELPFVATMLVVIPELDENGNKKMLDIAYLTAGGQPFVRQTDGGSIYVPDGDRRLNLRVRKVFATGTTAQNIVAFW